MSSKTELYNGEALCSYSEEVLTSQGTKTHLDQHFRYKVFMQELYVVPSVMLLFS